MDRSEIINLWIERRDYAAMAALHWLELVDVHMEATDCMDCNAPGIYIYCEILCDLIGKFEMRIADLKKRSFLIERALAR